MDENWENEELILEYFYRSFKLFSYYFIFI
jgi:hypothetical protein